MTVRDVVDRLELEVAADGGLEREVRGGYASDLLSDVLAGVAPGDVWITHQRHMNVVAVAKLKEVAGVVLAHGVIPTEEVVERATKESVNLLLSKDIAFQVAGKLHGLLGAADE